MASSSSIEQLKHTIRERHLQQHELVAEPENGSNITVEDQVKWTNENRDHDFKQLARESDITKALREGHTETDILVLGATGFTGKLITRYLSAHPQRTQFTLAIGGRSVRKLNELVRGLNLDPDKQDGVRVMQVDLKDEAALERVVKCAGVIINAIGPYFLSGTPIVQFCAQNGVHYLDLSGETHWHRHLIRAHDYAALRSRAIIVPSCAFNSVPADISVYLAAKTLRGISPALLPGKSTTVYYRKGGFSGGTAATTISTFGNVDHEILQRSLEPYSLSPIIGKQPKVGFEFVSRLSIPKQFGGQTYSGCFSSMASINTAVVQRTFGLFEVYHAEHGDDKGSSIRYSPNLIYSEFLLARNPITAFLFSLISAFVFLCLLFKPTRYLFSKIVPKPGDGPSESAMESGRFVITNLTVSAPPSSESSSNNARTDPVYVRTIIKGQGDPGHFSSAIMVSEAALAILLPFSSLSSSRSGGTKAKDNISNLPPLARKGGLLTPMSAFGDVLIKRLEETGKFEVSSEALGG